jgi:type III pantothenate kinase
MAIDRTISSAEARSGPFLSVDIGNTTVVIGLFHGDEVHRIWRLSSLVGRTGDEIGLILAGLLGGDAAGLGASGAVGLASVVPQLTRPFVQACRGLVGREPVVIRVDLDLGIPVRYVDPSQIGPDRLANAVAAAAEYELPAIVVDLGTTTNFDVIGPDGAFEGGAIAPGFFSSADELFRRAARLPRVELDPPERSIGRTTEEAIRAGVLYGTAGQIDGIVRRILKELGGKATVIATGGLAEAVVAESETIQTVDPALTLKGIRRISLRAL